MTRTHTISNSDDIIDSRDVIARIEELESERDDALEGDRNIARDSEERLESEPFDEAAFDAIWKWNEEDQAELDALKAFASEGENCAGWNHGEAMIRDSYFENYAEELADDIGAINASATWPNNCIDWERAARELQYDYTSAEFDGVTYWGRS